MGRTRALWKLAFVAALPLAVGACGSGAAGTASPSVVAPGAAGTTVKVTLQEWAVGTDVTTGPAGAYTFALTNTGPADVHEFVVIKTDLSMLALPTDADGAVSEAGGGMEVIGEVEDVAVGATQELKLTLTPGAYVFICNIYDETEKEAHYQEGMRTAFTVT